MAKQIDPHNEFPFVERFAIFRTELHEAEAPFMAQKQALEHKLEALINERMIVIMAKAQAYREELTASGYPYEETRLAIAEAIKSVSKSWTESALLEMSRQWADRIFIASEVLDWMKLGILSADLAWMIRAEGISPASLAAVAKQEHTCTKEGCPHEFAGQAIGRCPEWLRDLKAKVAALSTDTNWS